MPIIFGDMFTVSAILMYPIICRYVGEITRYKTHHFVTFSMLYQRFNPIRLNNNITTSPFPRFYTIWNTGSKTEYCINKHKRSYDQFRIDNDVIRCYHHLIEATYFNQPYCETKLTDIPSSDLNLTRPSNRPAHTIQLAPAISSDSRLKWPLHWVLFPHFSFHASGR